MSGKAYSGGLNGTWPVKGDTNWDSVVDVFLTTLSSHGHTGTGDGVQIATAAIAANAVTDTKIRLANQAALRGRNSAGSADVNIAKVNASDHVELGGVYEMPATTAPGTPGSGNGTVFYDSVTKKLCVKDDTGFARSFGNSNFSTTAQSPAATTRTYITGSSLSVPNNKLQIGTCFRWIFNMTKTAAGSAASTFDISFGTAGTTADTARVSFTKPAGTAAVDEGTVIINAICRGPLSASGVVVGQFTMTHNLAATGHAVIPCVNVNTVSGTFDVTTANLIVGVCITAGAADAITIQLVQSEAWNL